MIVYGDLQSGNCYKVKLLLALLDIEHRWQHIDIINNETHTDEFLVINPNGKIPAVRFDDGRALCESNAILGYFAENTPLLPNDNYDRAKVYQWLFFEQYSHEPCIAVARFINVYLGMPEDRQDEYQALQPKGHRALAVMEQQLSETRYLVGEQLTIADIALYAYTHVADQGGFDLSQYPNINRWLNNIANLKGYVGMG